MNSSSTYLSSHQAAENPSATCRLTGDDSIAHKESALYRKVRNLSSIHDGMPNLCRIPDGCGFVYTRMLRLSSFFCQKFEPCPKQPEKTCLFMAVLPEPSRRPTGSRKGTGPALSATRGRARTNACLDGSVDALPAVRGRTRGQGDASLPCRFSPPAREKARRWPKWPTSWSLFTSRTGKGKEAHGEGARRTRERSPSPTAVMRCGPAGPNAPRPSRARCPSPPATARKAPGRRGGRPA